MSLFMCHTCGCVENTACCNYWSSKTDGKPQICSECDPDIGKWHEHFTKRSAVGMLIDQSGYLWGKDASLPSSYTIMGEVMPPPHQGAKIMPALTPEQEMLKQAALAAQGKTMLSKEGCAFYDAADPTVILALLAQLEAHAQVDRQSVDQAPTEPSPGSARQGGEQDVFFTAVYRVPKKHSAEFASEVCASVFWSAASWSHALDERDAARGAISQPVQADTDKLLTIIASTYQIAGYHDAPAHILDVLADPEAATAEQVDAMLPYQPGLVQAVPDGMVLVPADPTDEMTDAACDASDLFRADFVRAWDAAIAVAPGDPAQ